MPKRLLFIFFLLFLFADVKAFHIAGGELSARWISGNNYELKLTLYRDCSNPQGADFDNTIILGIFDQRTDDLIDTVQITINQGDITDMSFSGPNCVAPLQVCMQQGIYMRNVIIPSTPNGCYMVWERCCRNNTILNIVDPQAAGMAFYEEIPDPGIHNSSPVFNSPPLPYVCSGHMFHFAYNASDADGDSLVYQLVDPLDGGHTGNGSPSPFSIPGGGASPEPQPYSPTSWQFGYSLANICGAAVPLTINSQTGEVTGVADMQGIYAMAVAVLEYRNGILIGIVRREIEFTAIECSGNTAPDVSPSILNKDYEIYASDTLFFDVTATDHNGDSIYMIHYGEVFAGTALTTITAPYAISYDTLGLDSVHTTFFWVPSCHQDREMPYQVTYEVSDNGCPLPLSVYGKINIRVKRVPAINPPNLLCIELIDANTLKISKVPDNTILQRYFGGFSVYRSVNAGPFNFLKNYTDHFTNDFYDSTAFDNRINNYCYVITGLNTCGDESVYSDTLCSIPAINYNKNYIETVSVENNKEIRMRWEKYPDGEYVVYHLYRKLNEADALWTEVNQLQNFAGNNWLDQDVNVNAFSYCYKIINVDVCGNISPESDEACTILLRGEAKLFENYMTWNTYKNWKGEVAKYVAERADVNISVPYREQLLIPGTDSIAYDRDLELRGGIFNYRIIAYEGQGGSDGESTSNEIQLIQSPIAYLPNAFTPDNDTKNDDWGPSTSFVKDFSILLFNRWGQLVFKSDSPSDRWNGTYNGKASPQGVYFYKVRFRGFDSNEMFEKTGSVTLIR